MNQVKIEPYSSVAHYKGAAEFWENRAHLLQNAVFLQQKEIDELREQLQACQEAADRGDVEEK